MRALMAPLILVLLAPASGCATFGGGASADESAFAARKKLVRELISRFEWGNAYAHADALHREHPGDAEVLTLRGIILRERKLVDDAEADLRAAVAADAKRAEAHAALGILLDATARSVEAETHHRKAVSLDDKNPAYLNNLGFSLLVRRKTKEALEVLGRSARLDPTNPRLRTNLGFAYAASGDMPRAAREFAIGTSVADARNNLGFAYEARGDLTNAYDLYRQALQVDPANQRARGNLDHVARKLGRPTPPELAAAPPAVSTTKPSEEIEQ